MGLLHWAWPDRAVFELEERPVMTPDRLGPGRHDQIIGVFEASTGFGRVDAVPDVFRRDAPDKPRDQSPPGKTVNHGVFFRHTHRVIAQGQDVPQDADFDPLRALAQRGSNQVRGRHRPIRAVVVLIKHHTVKTGFVANFHLRRSAV